jgi:hypothetical protein
MQTTTTKQRGLSLHRLLPQKVKRQNIELPDRFMTEGVLETNSASRMSQPTQHALKCLRVGE